MHIPTDNAPEATSTPIVTATASLKDMKAQADKLRKDAKELAGKLKEGKAQAKEAEVKAAQDLMSDIKALCDTKVIVGENDKAMTLTLEEALITGKATTIKVDIKGEVKERAHTVFLDAARVNSLQKLVVRFKKICANEEIRPKANPKAEETPAQA